MIKHNRSIDRGLAVLEAVHTSGRMSLAALAARTGLPKPTLLRICATLEARRWLFRRSSDGHYQLGSAFPRQDGMPNRVDRLVAVGKDDLLKLSLNTAIASDMAAGIGGGRVEIVDTSRAYKVHAIYPDAVGFRPSPVLSALGAAYLYALPADLRAIALNKIARSTHRENAEGLSKVASIFAGIAQRGYAVRSPGYWGRVVDYGALPTAIAVPIFAQDEPIGAINLVWNASDSAVETVAQKHLSELKATARRIGRSYAQQA